jgi:hypothetical protein
MKIIALAILFLSIIATHPASAQDNRAREMMKLAPEALKFVDCLNIVDHLVDIDPESGFNAFVARLARRLPEMPSTRQSRVFTALDIAGQHNSKSVLELGLADVFAPVFVLADKSAAECKRAGCTATLVQTTDWFGTSYVTFLESSIVFGSININRDSFLRVSDFIPLKSQLAYTDPAYGQILDFTIDYNGGSLFRGTPVYNQLITVVGSSQELHFGQWFLLPSCLDEHNRWRRGDSNRPHCDALLKFYDENFEGDMSMDAGLHESKLPIRIVSYDGPFDLNIKEPQEYCEAQK